MIKSVLFDLDGTLLDRDESLKRYIDCQYDRLNKWLGHIPKEDYMARFIELDCRGYVWKDKVYQQLVDGFLIQGIDWEELLQDYLNEFKNYCVPFPGLKDMLDELKRSGLALGIITNGYGQFQMDNIKALGIESYFDVILVSEWEGIKKPDPEIFIRAASRLGLVPNQCIFMGDHPENDVKASELAGMTGIWKKDDSWRPMEAGFLIEDLDEMPYLVRRIIENK